MNSRFRPLCVLFFAALAFLTTGPAGPVLAEDAPIKIEADHMSSTEKESSVIFSGDVDARQEDVRIRTDKMTVFYTDKAKAEAEAKVSQKVEKLVCNGNVEITRDDWLGKARDMVYLSKERQFILMGDAKAYQGQNMVSGDRIIYYLDEGRSEVVADRTSATIGAKADKEKKPKRVKMTILQQ